MAAEAVGGSESGACACCGGCSTSDITRARCAGAVLIGTSASRRRDLNAERSRRDRAVRACGTGTRRRARSQHFAPFCWRGATWSRLRRSRRGVAQPGRALGSGPRGRRFKSSRPDQFRSSEAQPPLGFLPGQALRFRARFRNARPDDEGRAGKAGRLRLKFLQRARDGPRSVARTCRDFGISRKSFYKWKRRHATHGAAGVVRPVTTAAPIAARHVALTSFRRSSTSGSTYHFGPSRIAAYLAALSSARRSRRPRCIASSCGTALNRLPANQKHRPHGKRWKRYEKAQPGHRLQLDVKFLERIPGTKTRLYQFTAIDDCTRIRVLKVFDACNQRDGDPIHRRRASGACRFGCTSSRPTMARNFSRASTGISRRLDIRHVYIRPRTPHLNGKVERSHRVDDQEFYQLLDRNGITRRYPPVQREAA